MEGAVSRRQAKKVMRGHWQHRRNTIGAAVRISMRCWRQSIRRTKGHRWGRWDPKESIAPWEIPF
jgi:hypothetical protein